MKKFNFKQKIVAIIALSSMLAVLLVLKDNPKVCEFFATTFARGWIFVFGNILGFIPISFYELLLIATIISIIVIVVLLIVNMSKRHWLKVFSIVCTVAIIVLAFVNLYTATASFTYNRNPLPSQVYAETDVKTVEYAEVLHVAEVVVEELNEAYQNTQHDENGNIVFPYTFAQLNDILKEEYKKLEFDYFSSFTPNVKSIFNQRIMNELHISGVFFAPFGEPNVNVNNFDMYLPCTMAHELAHAKGVMRESDANFVAYYVLFTSNNYYLRYSVLVQLYYHAISLVNMYPNSLKDVTRLNESVHKGVLVERKNASNFYAQFTLLDDFGNFINDVYLKLQNQSGTPSYQKPSITKPTQQLDDDGRPIIAITKFGGEQYFLINLYRNNLLNF